MTESIPSQDALLLSDEEIEQIFLSNGFKKKEQADGTLALNDYVLTAAKALLEVQRKRLNLFDPMEEMMALIGAGATLQEVVDFLIEHQKILSPKSVSLYDLPVPEIRYGSESGALFQLAQLYEFAERAQCAKYSHNSVHQYKKQKAHELMLLIEKYWSLAFNEGKENRTHDTKNGDASKTYYQIKQLLRELSV